MTESQVSSAGEASTLQPDATLEVLGDSEDRGAICANLTPFIRGKIRGLQSGQVLLVRVDDESARLDIAAWCRLTGNELALVREQPGGVIEFYIRKR